VPASGILSRSGALNSGDSDLRRENIIHPDTVRVHREKAVAFSLQIINI
jgi:hypothetical protein